jgi:hypothetical protein
MTDPRLRSTRPIDDEIPFQDAEDVPNDDRPEDEDAIVTPAAAERARRMEDRDVERSAPESELPEEPAR